MNLQPADQIGSAILLRHLDGDASPAETRLVEEWLARDEKNRAELERLEEAWELSARLEYPVFDRDALWDRIQARIAELPEAAATPPAAQLPAGERPLSLSTGVQRTRRQAPSPWRCRSFVGGLLAAAAAVAVMVYLPRHDPAPDAEPIIAMKTYTTRPGEVGRLTFPDGTTVVMGGATTLRAPVDWETSPREVYLDGQAYFEVTHDPENTFRVHTERVVAEDLGTAFAISAYANDSIHEIAVSEGIVELTGAQVEEPVVLNANDVAHIAASGEVSTTRNANIDRHIGWVRRRLVFDQARLADAVRTIERHFGVEVQVTDSLLLDKRFTGTIRSTTLYEDLNGLAILLDAEYERQGKRVILSLKE